MIGVGSSSPTLERTTASVLCNLGLPARTLASDWVPFGKTTSWCYSHTWPRFADALHDCSGLLWLWNQDVSPEAVLARLTVLRWLVAEATGRNIHLMIVGPVDSVEREAGLFGIGCSELHLASILNNSANWKHADSIYEPPSIMEHLDVSSLYLVALQQTLHNLKNGELVSGEIFSMNSRQLGELFAAIRAHFRMMPPNVWTERMETVCTQATQITQREPLPLDEHVGKWSTLNTEADRQVALLSEILRDMGLQKP